MRTVWLALVVLLTINNEQITKSENTAVGIHHANHVAPSIRK
jgi:hypothetical protein